MSQALGNSTNGGPELVQALDEPGMRDMLVLPKWDGYARSMSDGIGSVNRGHKGGALVKVLDCDDLDLTQPMDRRVLAFSSPLAEHERHRVVRRWNKGRAAARWNAVALQHSSW